MSKLTANDLKTRGVSILDDALEGVEEATISVRGKDKYVVMDMERYNHLRVCELEAAYRESIEAHEKGDYIEESAAEHIKRMHDEI